MQSKGEWAGWMAHRFDWHTAPIRNKSKCFFHSTVTTQCSHFFYPHASSLLTSYTYWTLEHFSPFAFLLTIFYSIKLLYWKYSFTHMHVFAQHESFLLVCCLTPLPLLSLPRQVHDRTVLLERLPHIIFSVLQQWWVAEASLVQFKAAELNDSLLALYVTFSHVSGW